MDQYYDESPQPSQKIRIQVNYNLNLLLERLLEQCRNQRDF